MKIQIKKTIAVLLVVLLSTMLLVSMASAKTDPKTDLTKLPTKSELLTFVNDYQGSDFVETVSAASESVNPEWPWDIWQDKYGNRYISFYYQSKHKYVSIYYNNEGNIIPKTLKLKLIKSYRGV